MVQYLWLVTHPYTYYIHTHTHNHIKPVIAVVTMGLLAELNLWKWLFETIYRRTNKQQQNKQKTPKGMNAYSPSLLSFRQAVIAHITVWPCSIRPNNVLFNDQYFLTSISVSGRNRIFSETWFRTFIFMSLIPELIWFFFFLRNIQTNGKQRIQYNFTKGSTFIIL